MKLVDKFLSENKDILNLTEATYKEGSVEEMLPDQYMRLAIEHSSAKAPVLSAVKLYRYDAAGSIFDNMSTHDDDRKQYPNYHVKSFCPLLHQPVVGIRDEKSGETFLVSPSKEALDIVVSSGGVPEPGTKEPIATPKVESFLAEYFPEVNEELSEEEKKEYDELKAAFDTDPGAMSDEKKARMKELSDKFSSAE